VVERWSLPLVPVLVVIGVVILYNAGGLAGVLVDRMGRAAEARQQISAVLDLTDDYDFTVAEDGDRVPAVQWAPDVLLSDAETWQDEGWLHVGPYGLPAELTARAVLGLEATDGEAPADLSRCEVVDPDDAALVLSQSRALVRSASSSIGVALSASDVVGTPRSVSVTPEEWTAVSLAGPSKNGFDLVVAPGAVAITVCPA
jgi:hypothetical protein